MPAFRNVKITRSSARAIQCDDQGWQKYTPDQLISSYPATRGRSISRSPSPDSPYSPRSYTPSRSPSPAPVSKSKPKTRNSNTSEHIPRPRNAFIIYRSFFYALHKGKQDQNWISVHAGMTWKSMPVDEKQPFIEQAEQEKAEHKVKYPGYTYTPGSKAGAARRRTMLKKKARAAAQKIMEETAPASPSPDAELESRSPSPMPCLAYPSTPVGSPIDEDTPELTDGSSSRMSSEEISTPVEDFVDTADIPELLLPPLLDESKVEQIILKVPPHSLVCGLMADCLLSKPNQCATQPLPPNYRNLGDAFLPSPTVKAYDSRGYFICPPESSFGTQDPLYHSSSADINLNFDYSLKILPQAALDGRYNHSGVFAFAHVDGLGAHDPYEELISHLEEPEEPVHCPATEQFMNDFFNFDAFDQKKC